MVPGTTRARDVVRTGTGDLRIRQRQQPPSDDRSGERPSARAWLAALSASASSGVNFETLQCLEGTALPSARLSKELGRLQHVHSLKDASRGPRLPRRVALQRAELLASVLTRDEFVHVHGGRRQDEARQRRSLADNNRKTARAYPAWIDAASVRIPGVVEACTHQGYPVRSASRIKTVSLRFIQKALQRIRLAPPSCRARGADFRLE